MAKASKYNRARIRSRVRRPKRRGGSMMWSVITAVIVVVGVALVVVTVADRKTRAEASPKIGDHWHAALGVDVCGEWLPNMPEFLKRTNEPTLSSGLHSHGDGLMHIEPGSGDESGARATVGRFMEFGGWSLSDTSFKLWDSVEHKNGEKCGSGADAKPAVVQWSVGKYGKTWTGKPRTGNPADYHPKNGDIVAIYFLPEGDRLPEPKNVDQAFASNNVGSGAPVSGPTPAPQGSGSTATTAPAGGTTPTTPATSTTPTSTP